eukprot:sb/3464505/
MVTECYHHVTMLTAASSLFDLTTPLHIAHTHDNLESHEKERKHNNIQACESLSECGIQITVNYTVTLRFSETDLSVKSRFEYIQGVSNIVGNGYYGNHGSATVILPLLTTNEKPWLDTVLVTKYPLASTRRRGCFVTKTHYHYSLPLPWLTIFKIRGRYARRSDEFSIIRPENLPYNFLLLLFRLCNTLFIMTIFSITSLAPSPLPPLLLVPPLLVSRLSVFWLLSESLPGFGIWGLSLLDVEGGDGVRELVVAVLLLLQLDRLPPDPVLLPLAKKSNMLLVSEHVRVFVSLSERVREEPQLLLEPMVVLRVYVVVGAVSGGILPPTPPLGNIPATGTNFRELEFLKQNSNADFTCTTAMVDDFSDVVGILALTVPLCLFPTPDPYWGSSKDYLSTGGMSVLNYPTRFLPFLGDYRANEFIWETVKHLEDEETIKQPIRTRYLGHVTGYISQSETSIS